jgi:hypothetical protein
VLDALGAGDRAWAYASGPPLREAVLPDLLTAAGSLRADVQVGLAAVAVKCGFQPLLAVDELFIRVRWDAPAAPAPWAAVLRMQAPTERYLRCMNAVAPNAQETSLDRRMAWQLPRAIIVWNNGVFVVASAPAEAHSLLERMAHPEPAALQARTGFAGVLLLASVAKPNPLGVEALDVRWTAKPPVSMMEVHSRFAGTSNARRAETIFRDSLLEVLGSTTSLEPALQGSAGKFVQGAAVTRSDDKLDVNLDMAPLVGQTALVAKLTSLAVHGVRLYSAWGRMGEARDDVYLIARALADYAVRLRDAGRPARFPPTAPMIPDEIPYGKPVVPNPRAFAHPSWQDIHYSSDRPTFYACDFVTAKDGKSVVVRARGDIDGDGTTSLFELDVRLDARGVPALAPLIRERDPEE